VLGLLGGSGAILPVPGLVYVLRAEPHAAIAASLAIVAVGALMLLSAWLMVRHPAASAASPCTTSRKT
jgi:uncharacterized membrane protein YfcA